MQLSARTKGQGSVKCARGGSKLWVLGAFVVMLWRCSGQLEEANGRLW